MIVWKRRRRLFTGHGGCLGLAVDSATLCTVLQHCLDLFQGLKDLHFITLVNSCRRRPVIALSRVQAYEHVPYVVDGTLYFREVPRVLLTSRNSNTHAGSNALHVCLHGL